VHARTRTSMNTDPHPLQLRIAAHHGRKRDVEIFTHIGLHVSRQFHTPESFPALFGSRGLQLQYNAVHAVVCAVCELGLCVLTVKRFSMMSWGGVVVHAAGLVALPALFIKRRGPHNWYRPDPSIPS